MEVSGQNTAAPPDQTGGSQSRFSSKSAKFDESKPALDSSTRTAAASPVKAIARAFQRACRHNGVSVDHRQ